MKTLLYISILLFSINKINAQTTTPEIISSTGDYYSNSNLSISWTIGEPITETHSVGTVVITQGFQQALYSIITIDEQIQQGVIVNVYPNPATDFINIEIINPESNNYKIQIYDELGKLLFDKKYETLLQINISKYTKATYFLKIFNDNSSNSYKIIKQ